MKISPFFIHVSAVVLAATWLLLGTGTALAADTTRPTISKVSPVEAETGTQITLTATYSDDDSGVDWCNLYVEFEDVGSMTLQDGVASKNYSFFSGGVYTVFVHCRDLANNAGNGANTSVFVTDSSGGGDNEPPTVDPILPVDTSPDPTPVVITPGLVKFACPATGSQVNDPCRAVYFRSSSGTRHAFPNQNTYFTWYEDFSLVEEISTSEMAALTLGSNITYRPGVRMLKFTTDDKVYAVGHAGLLRWVETEAITTALYGANWNTMIDDLPDTFAADYTFGSSILNASEFSPSAQTAAIANIEDNF